MSGLRLPSKLLHRVVELNDTSPAIALCPDFESGFWRYKQLAAHLFDWLPDVALRPKEREALLHEPHKLLARSCRRLFDTDDPSARGEVGEIILHAACRQEFGTTSFVARLFYKMRTNDSVTSVDVVHAVYNESEEKLELWLGEAKLYKDVRQARYKAFQSVEALWNPEFLSEMKALIGPKIESGMPHEEELSWLFEDETSLDNIISRIVIPICIAADFDPTKKTKSRTRDYIREIETELRSIHEYFQGKIPDKVSFVVIFVPLDCKDKLEDAINKKAQAFL